MPLHVSALAFAAVAAAQSPPARPPLSGAPETVTAIVDVAVVPMDTDRVLSHQTVLVQHGWITALGPSTQTAVPANAVRIDGRGKYLIPGLADMHAHVPGIYSMFRLLRSANPTDSDRVEAERMLFLYLANGVTTIRVMHGSALMLALRARAAAGDLPSPRIYTATPMVVSATPDSAARIPAAAKTAGYDLIKMYGIAGESFDSLVAAARRVGLPFAGHIPGNNHDPAGLMQAVRAGYASIEHLNGFVDNYGGGDLFLDSVQVQAAARAMRQAGIWSCPTLVVLGLNTHYFNADTLLQWPELRYVRDGRRQEWQRSWMAEKPLPVDTVHRWMTVRRQLVKVLHDAGVGVLLGTDASVPGIMPGFAVHRELVELVNAGLTPYEALATGTRNPAVYFGTLDSTGTIAVGKRADLVLLTGNPLQDIHQTTHRAGIMIAGRWWSQAELERRLAAIEGTLF